jgi:hypothetical protein
VARAANPEFVWHTVDCLELGVTAGMKGWDARFIDSLSDDGVVMGYKGGDWEVAAGFGGYGELMYALEKRRVGWANRLIGLHGSGSEVLPD